MKYKFTLITPSAYSSTGNDNCVDQVSEDFARYCKHRARRILKFSCKYIKTPALAYITDFEEFEQRILSDSEYAVIIVSPGASQAIKRFHPRLLVFLTRQPKWQNRFLFVLLGDIDLTDSVSVHPPIKFSLNDWRKHDELSWTALFEVFKVQWIPFNNDNTEDEETVCQNLDNDVNCDFKQKVGISEIQDSNKLLYMDTQTIKETYDDIEDDSKLKHNNRLNCLISNEESTDGFERNTLCNEINNSERRNDSEQSKQFRNIQSENFAPNDHQNNDIDETITNEIDENKYNSNEHITIEADCTKKKNISSYHSNYKSVVKENQRWISINFWRFLYFIVSNVLQCLSYYNGSVDISRHGNSRPGSRPIPSKCFLEKCIKLLLSPIKIVKDIFFGIIWKIRNKIITVFMAPLVFSEHYLDDLLSNNSNEKPVRPSPLKNMKETCYMNSMIQALASSKCLLKQLTDFKKTKTYNKKLYLFTQLLSDVNRSYPESYFFANTTTELKAFMNTINWNRPSQQDAFQLLSFCINAIHNEVGKEDNMPPKFEILHTFSENIKFNKIQVHLALSIPLCGTFSEKPGAKLTSLIDAFFEPSDIDDGLHKTTMYLFGDIPKVLILHIQANEWNEGLGEYVKPTYYIEYGEKLNYTFHVKKNVDGMEEYVDDVEYGLVAVVHHMGTVSGGHYITYRKHGAQWYLTNDEQVEEISFRCDIVPYVMVYERIN